MSQTPQPIDTTAAEAYEKFMVPGMFAHWTERVVRLAAPQAGEHVLDVACGTGIGARVAARSVGPSGKVTGLDLDPGVIEVARKVAQGTAAPMAWHCASALKMPFHDAQFDLCLCLQGCSFSRTVPPALPRFAACLNHRGVCSSLWGPLERNIGHYAVVRALENQKVDASAAKKACSFANPDEIRDTVTRAGFTDFELRTEDGVSHFASVQAFIDGMTIGSPSTRHAVALLPEQGRERFVKEVSAMLEPHAANGELAYPMRTHILCPRGLECRDCRLVAGWCVA